MLKQIVWSPSSSRDFENILQYIENNWGNRVANNFITLTDDIIKQIALNPKQFPTINTELNIRKCVITKHNTLFYRDRDDRIDVLRIYDTRQDPQQLKFI